MEHTILKMLAPMIQNKRAGLREAHAAAADFHQAMAAAMEAQAEIDDVPEDGVRMTFEDKTYWEKQYAEQLGLAAVAMQKVPVKWLAMLGIDSQGEDK